MTTVWQQLGAFVATAENLSDDALDKFAGIGGKWIVPVVYGDNHSGPWNRDHLHETQLRARKRGITVGGWFNGWGGDPNKDAQAIANISQSNGLNLVILDLEAAYQWPSGNPNLMPTLVFELRKLLPFAEIGVSTNSMTNTSIWNGRTLNIPKSFYDLKIRVLPQWYSWIYNQDNAYLPERQMKWLRDASPQDGNFRDNNAPTTKFRGVPLSYVHGTLEVTGMENASLDDELRKLAASKKYGYTIGFSIYTLENMLESDYAILRSVRGTLYDG